MRSLLVLAATALVAAGTAACGGGEQAEDEVAPVEPGATFTLTDPAVEADESRPGPPPDQSHWAREVDAACEEWQERLDALEPPEDAASLEPFLAEALPLIRRQIEAVEEVRPPAGSAEADEARRLVEGMRRVEEALARYRAAVEADDQAAAQQALAEAGAAGAETRELALELGVTECGGYAGG